MTGSNEQHASASETCVFVSTPWNTLDKLLRWNTFCLSMLLRSEFQNKLLCAVAVNVTTSLHSSQNLSNLHVII